MNNEEVKSKRDDFARICARRPDFGPVVFWESDRLTVQWFDGGLACEVFAVKQHGNMLRAAMAAREFILGNL